MKMACVMIGPWCTDFYIVCRKCEERYRFSFDASSGFKFIDFDFDQFPSEFGQDCFTCYNCVKEGPPLFDRNTLLIVDACPSADIIPLLEGLA